MIGTVVLGVGDIPRSTAFWSAALDYRPRPKSDDTFVILEPKSGTGTALALDRSGSPPEEFPRQHLDLYADDQTAEVERLVALGATRVDWPFYDDHSDFVVLADTEGNRFCVIDTTGSDA